MGSRFNRLNVFRGRMQEQEVRIKGHEFSNTGNPSISVHSKVKMFGIHIILFWNSLLSARYAFAGEGFRSIVAIEFYNLIVNKYNPPLRFLPCLVEKRGDGGEVEKIEG
jgi:hypothetical protein